MQLEPRSRRFFRAATVALGILATQALLPWSQAVAYTATPIYAFCSQSGCSDGYDPLGGLLMDGTGNLFGTASSGGSFGDGTIFELVPNADKTKWKFKVIHQFCSENFCADGETPSSALIMDTQGNLYGTTPNGGALPGAGVVFELMPSGRRWKLKVLHTFCPANDDCLDGKNPFGGLTYQGAASGAPYDGVSPLYGNARLGGLNAKGVAYELDPPAPGKKHWKQKVIYNFCSLAPCADGGLPEYAYIMDGAGNLYATTWYGGANGCNGTVFELSPNARRTKWTETVLHSFGELPNCGDGSNARGELAMDSAGNLYGTTLIGGAYKEGVLFKLVPDGENSQESVLYSFCSLGSCYDGNWPMAGPTLDANGNLFGTATCIDRGHGCIDGVAYEMSGGTYSVIHLFCQNANQPSSQVHAPDVSGNQCLDGSEPKAPVILDASGNVFGVTTLGGANGGGTIFELTP